MCMQGEVGASNRLRAVADKDQAEACAFWCGSAPCGNAGCTQGPTFSGGFTPEQDIASLAPGEKISFPNTPEALRVAKMLHESIRGSVANYVEWDQLEDTTRNVFMTQARTLLDGHVLLPLDDASACSGCRAYTNSLDRLDNARRDFIAVLEEARALRLALAGIIGASTKEELEQMAQVLAAMPGDEEDRDVALVGVRALLNATLTVGWTAPPMEPDKC